MTRTIYDVIQIGYGPVSESLALMLGRQGRSIAVCERWTDALPAAARGVRGSRALPRACRQRAWATSCPWSRTQGRSISGSMPTGRNCSSSTGRRHRSQAARKSISCISRRSKAALDDAVRAQPERRSASGLGGRSALDAGRPNLRTSTLRHLDSGRGEACSQRAISSAATAPTRSCAKRSAGAREDRGFEADWLVIDVLLKDGVTDRAARHPGRRAILQSGATDDDRARRRARRAQVPALGVHAPAAAKRVDRPREPRTLSGACWSPGSGPSEVELVRHTVYNVPVADGEALARSAAC